MMLHLLLALIGDLLATVKSRGDLAIENLALRQQLAILKRKAPRPRLTDADRVFWAALSRLRTFGGRYLPFTARPDYQPVVSVKVV